MNWFNQQIRLIAINLAGLLFIILLGTTFAFAQAQSNAGDLNGVILDPNNAVVAGATVTARNESINITRSVTSAESGEYRIVNLPPGEYEIAVEAASFKRAVVPAARVTIGEAAKLDVQLELGAVGETVTVSSATIEVIETTRTAVSTTIDQQRIENLPINQRDYLGFTLTSSNVGRDNGRQIGPAPTSGLNIGGQRGRSSLVQVDGADNTDNSINAARSTVSQEAVQEFQVVTNSFAPEFGRSAGGVVNVVTKRGTNDFTGNIFGFIRDRKTQARAAFAPFKSAFTRTQFGATLGGPITKDRIYFFGAFERRQRNESGFFTSDIVRNLTSSVTVGAPFLPFTQTFSRLTPQQASFAQNELASGNPARAGAAIQYLYLASSGGNTGLTGQNPLISAGGAIAPGQPIGQRFLLSGAPVPVNTRDANGNPIAFRPLLDLQRVFPVTDRTNFSSLRIDQNINQENQLSLRGGYNTSRLTGIQVESQNQSLGQNDFSRTGVAEYKDTTFTANLITTHNNIANEARFQFGKRKASFLSQFNDSVAINIADTAFIGRELFSPVIRTENRFQILDNFTVVAGNHTLKFGADVNFVDIPEATFELDFSGLFNFGTTPAAQLGLNGFPDLTGVQSYGLGLGSFIQGFSNSTSAFNNKPLAFFAQDSWKIRRNVTINYGLRYDVELTPVFAPTAFRDPLSGIALSEADVAAAQNSVNVVQGIPRDKNNFAPRAAVAWDIFADGKTVLRTAFGLFYDHPSLNIGFNADLVDSTQQQQAVLTVGSPDPTAPLNGSQVFQGTVCGTQGANPLCPTGLRTPGVAPTAIYQFGRQRFDPSQFIGYSTVLPFILPVGADFKYASALQGNLSLERQLDRNTSVALQYQFVRARNLPRPTDLNQPRADLQIENFRRFTATAANPRGSLPTNQTDVLGFSVPTVSSAAYTVVIPGIIAVNNATGLRFINPAIANFFRPASPNYFLAAALSGGAVSKQVLDSQLAGTVRTPGLLAPFGSVNAQVSDGNSEYNGLTVDLKRRFANNFTFLASYTWSHSLDDSSDLQTLLIPQEPQNLRNDFTDSLFDQRHRFVFSGLVSSPISFRGSNNLFKKLLTDFTVAPILEISSGRPFNILANFDVNNDLTASTDRPGVQSDGTLCLPTNTDLSQAAINSPCSAFRLTETGAVTFNVGNLGRNRGITHPYASLDLRIARAIRFGERIRLNIIAEGFNLFNRFNEAAASPSFQSVNSVGERDKKGRYYSISTAAFDQRQFQFAFKLNF